MANGGIAVGAGLGTETLVLVRRLEPFRLERPSGRGLLSFADTP